MNRKILSVIVAVFMLIAVFPLSAGASASDNVRVREVVRGVGSSQENDGWEFSECGFMVIRSWDNRLGVIDRRGIFVIPFGSFERIGRFSEGFAPALKDGKWGFIDGAGNTVIPFEFGRAGSFGDGLANVGIDGKWGFIDITGNVVIPFEFDEAWSFQNGLANVRIGNRWTLIDRTGEATEMHEAERERFVPINHAFLNEEFDWWWQFWGADGRQIDEFIIVVKDNKQGIADRTGELILPLEFNRLELFGFDSDGDAMFIVTRASNNEAGVIDIEGNVIVPFGYYDNIYWSGHDYAVVQRGSYHGMIDIAGELILPIAYDWINIMGRNIVQVQRGRETATLNVVTGASLDDMLAEFDRVHWWGWRFLEYENLMVVRRDGKQGVVDIRTGEIILPLEYGWVRPIAGDFVLVSEDGVWSILRIITTRDISVTFGATKYMLDGEPFDVQTMVYNGVAYLPAAYLAHKLGLSARWDAATNITTLSSTGTVSAEPPLVLTSTEETPVTRTIAVFYDETLYYLDGVRFSEASIVYNGVAYLPAAYLARKLGLTAVWDEATNITALTSER